MPKRAGFTLVELLVVLAVIGLLASLLLPAVQAAREAGRRSACKNRLRQLALATTLHTETVGSFPSGGWGSAWVGHAGRGSGPDQPGGWAYSILPFIERGELQELELAAVGADQPRLRAQRSQVALKEFICPSRRGVFVWPTQDHYLGAPGVVWPHLQQPYGSDPIESAARSDFAMNLGSTSVQGCLGPESLEAGDAGVSPCPDVSDFDGIAHLRSEVRPRQVTDGMSHTYLVGEKFLSPAHYADGLAYGDNETLYSGFSSDLNRSTRLDLTPARDHDALRSFLGDWRFGSAHPSGFHMAFCDASVRSIEYDIDAELHRDQGARRPPDRPSAWPPTLTSSAAYDGGVVATSGRWKRGSPLTMMRVVRRQESRRATGQDSRLWTTFR